MKKEAVLAAVRHLLTAGGGLLVAQGVTEAAAMETAIGAVMTLVGFGWSLWRKYAREKREEAFAVKAGAKQSDATTGALIGTHYVGGL